MHTTPAVEPFFQQLVMCRSLDELRGMVVARRKERPITVIHPDGNPKDKSWLTLQVALALKELTKKEVLVIDLYAQSCPVEKIWNTSFSYDYVIVNCPKDETAIVRAAQVVLNCSKKKFEQKNAKVVDCDIPKARRQKNLDWLIGHCARVIARKTIGLALGSGTVGGLCHLGVLKYFEEQKMPIDMIAGCSGGAMYGALWNILGSTEKVIQSLRAPASKKFSNNLEFAWSTKGFSGGKYLQKIFQKACGSTVSFRDCRIPLQIVATNLQTRKTEFFTSGLLWPAVRASISLPIVFTPVKIRKTWYIDGGASDPLPVDVLRNAGMDKVIAVYATSQTKQNRKVDFHNFINVFLDSRTIMSDTIAAESAAKADVFINPDVSRFGMFDYHHLRKLIRLGYQVAQKVLQKDDGRTL
jgi:NTE family protein